MAIIMCVRCVRACACVCVLSACVLEVEAAYYIIIRMQNHTRYPCQICLWTCTSLTGGRRIILCSPTDSNTTT